MNTLSGAIFGGCVKAFDCYDTAVVCILQQIKYLYISTIICYNYITLNKHEIFMMQQHKIYLNNGIYGFYGRCVDEFGTPVKRTKQSHPYSYDGFVQWRTSENKIADATIYSDRLQQWDYEKCNELCQKHFGNKCQYWNERDPKKIEEFLSEWTDNKNLKLTLIMEYCNVSSGYPVWRFDYSTKEDT